MNRFLIALLILGLSFSTMAHRGHKAIYSVSNNGDELLIKVKFEVPDIQSALNDEQCKTPERLAFCAADYAIDHLDIKLDGNSVPLYFDSGTLKDGFLLMYLKTDSKAKCRDSISIQNTCFNAFGHHYDNDVIIEWNGKITRYTLNRKRTTLNHQLP